MHDRALGLPPNHPLLWYATEQERKRGAKAEYDETHGWVVIDGHHRWALLPGFKRVDLNAKTSVIEYPCAHPKCENKFELTRKDQTTCGSSRCKQWAARRRRRGVDVTLQRAR